MGLIDADVLIEEMKKTETEYENEMTCPSWWSAFNVIREQPTAYDIDKVVDELEKASKDVSRGYLGKDNNKYHKHYKAVKLSRAIEIVKQGGVSDDCCEWESHRNNYVTSCEEDFVPMMRGYKYCPYCGKKIKVVE